ncbi:MAG: hypothetical protein IGS03_09385 [Candidatus Sericytochromatia bacterium]|nr:hypothetical protein [Candidatus Sericytochromatia bacterium]
MSAPSPSRKPFELTDESPLGYFSKLTEFIYDPHYARYLRRIAMRYDRETLPAELELIPFFVDALIFETYIDGQTPLDRFFQTYQQQMTPEQRQVYRDFKNYRFGCYQVMAHEGHDIAMLRDLVDDDTLQLCDSDARRFLFQGFYVVARLLPFEGRYVPTGACAVINVKTDQQALAMARLLRQPPLIIDSRSDNSGSSL